MLRLRRKLCILGGGEEDPVLPSLWCPVVLGGMEGEKSWV